MEELSWLTGIPLCGTVGKLEGTRSERLDWPTGYPLVSGMRTELDVEAVMEAMLEGIEAGELVLEARGVEGAIELETITLEVRGLVLEVTPLEIALLEGVLLMRELVLVATEAGTLVETMMSKEETAETELGTVAELELKRMKETVSEELGMSTA